jgi:hypothetical protein
MNLVQRLAMRPLVIDQAAKDEAEAVLIYARRHIYFPGVRALGGRIVNIEERLHLPPGKPGEAA